ncbi:hypothetical protein IW261DRAFT_1424761 [Armillaria novae-zelandiae]|uniref:Uncharacterized protein n=1 Tax=Armillaria novae-zelandiae TaxID=153914 RepID=A0AA39NU74_9AGAR|nr:hypothetical protein IW261DRAFT_1424761 [Armillaria novae-zelandiae]
MDEGMAWCLTGKVHGLGVGLQALAKDDPSSSGEEADRLYLSWNSRVLARGYVLMSSEQGHVIVVTGSANDRLDLAFALQSFEMLSTSWTHNRCLDTMYRRPVKEGMALLKWWGVIQMVPLKCGVHNTALVMHRLSRHRTDHGQQLLRRHNISTSGEQGHGVVEAVGCLVHMQGLQMIVLVWLSLLMTQDIQLVFSGNDFCLKTMYQRPASEGTVSSRLKAVGCLVEVWGLQTVALDVQHTLDSDVCLDTTYQHPADSGLGVVEWVGWLLQVWGPHTIVQPWSRSPPQRLLPGHDILKSNSYANHLQKWTAKSMEWTPFEEDSGLGNCVGCLTHSATVFLCEQIVEISRTLRDFFFGQIGPTMASCGFPLERFQREATLGQGTNGRMAPPICAFENTFGVGKL